MDNEFITFTIGKQKKIALIAHDGKKQELIEWCAKNQDVLKNHFLWYRNDGKNGDRPDRPSRKGL